MAPPQLRIVGPFPADSADDDMDLGTSAKPLHVDRIWLNSLDVLLSGLKVGDPSADGEFSGWFQHIACHRILGLDQREIAAALDITPLTLQRWRKGCHLPYPMPRRIYLSELGELLRRRIESLRLGADFDIPGDED